MNATDRPTDELIDRMRSGDTDALAEVFSQCQDRLRRIIRFRLDYRIAGRISDSDVLQESYLAAAKRLQHFAADSEMDPFLWLRLITSQKLVDLHRQHVAAERRDVRREISIADQPMSAATSVAIAAHLIGGDPTASKLLEQAERINRLEQTLNEMDATDREVIALRHFEELSNVETAAVLGIEPPAASKRYVRAMRRLSELMASLQPSQSE
ncbi:RNA polymerase sigma factor CnrH [Stieleria varia]|uniref:RNA polymerase sigma factor CnrH n=2 Tax=Stieleria varia TaxID=2528005 RepID=A0A5C6A505_9BACT|nr:RNA polymerase sigma factor CnrH [Stieleria varia]